MGQNHVLDEASAIKFPDSQPINSFIPMIETLIATQKRRITLFVLDRMHAAKQ